MIWVRKKDYRYDTKKYKPEKKTMDILDFKLKGFLLFLCLKMTVKKKKDKIQTSGSFLQITYITKSL